MHTSKLQIKKKMAKSRIIDGLSSIFKKKPYQLGLVLSGGGIKGMSHAGVLKALEEANIKPQIISGVSAGAIVGALYAGGTSPDEIASIFESVKFRKMTKVQRPDGGFFNIKPFEEYLESHLKVKTFEELKITLHISATNLDTGEINVFTKGKLIDAVIASASVPILFSPKVIDNQHFVDGGVLQNFPVSTIRNECEQIIGVNLNPMINVDYKKTVMGVALRTYNFMYRSNTLLDKGMCDFLIEPEGIVNFDMFDLDKSMELFEMGYKTTKKRIKQRLTENNK